LQQQATLVRRQLRERLGVDLLERFRRRGFQQVPIPRESFVVLRRLRRLELSWGLRPKRPMVLLLSLLALGR
jgi:hypothetical protein